MARTGVYQSSQLWMGHNGVLSRVGQQAQLSLPRLGLSHTVAQLTFSSRSKPKPSALSSSSVELLAHCIVVKNCGN
jgi:hypothetical protein